MEFSDCSLTLLSLPLPPSPSLSLAEHVPSLQRSPPSPQKVVKFSSNAKALDFTDESENTSQTTISLKSSAAGISNRKRSSSQRLQDGGDGKNRKEAATEKVMVSFFRKKEEKKKKKKKKKEKRKEKKELFHSLNREAASRKMTKMKTSLW